MNRKRASALLAGAALLGAVRSPVRAQAPVTLRIGVAPIEPAAEVYYAKDMGFFAKAGLDVDIQSMQGSPLIVAAIVSNALDIGFDTLDLLAEQHQKGLPLVIIAATHDYASPATSRTQALHRSGELADPASSGSQRKDRCRLNAAQPRPTRRRSLDRPKRRGLIDDQVRRGSVSGDAGRARRGPRRCRVGRRTVRHRDPEDGSVLFYGFDGIAKHFIVGAWVTTRQWANDHPDLVSRFSAVMHDTAVWANKNPKQSGDILAKYVKIDTALIATMARNHYAEQLTPALLQPLIDTAAKYNGFKTFPAQELMYKSS